MLFIVYRIAFVGWLCRESIRATVRTGNVHAILLFGYVGILLFNGQITGQGAQNGFAWLFVGFTLAASQIHAEKQYVRTEVPLIARADARELMAV